MFSTFLLSSVVVLGDVHVSDKDDFIICRLLSVCLHVCISVPGKGPSDLGRRLHPEPVTCAHFCGKSWRWPRCVNWRVRFLVGTRPDRNCIKLVVLSLPLKGLLGRPRLDYELTGLLKLLFRLNRNAVS